MVLLPCQTVVAKKAASAELVQLIRERLGERSLSWLAKEVYDRTEAWHDPSYYSHVLAGDSRMAPKELEATCTILEIDASWAFPEMGWPQPQEREGDDERVLPALYEYLAGLTKDDQGELISVLPLVLKMRSAFSPQPSLRVAEEPAPYEESVPLPNSGGQHSPRKLRQGAARKKIERAL